MKLEGPGVTGQPLGDAAFPAPCAHTVGTPLAAHPDSSAFRSC
jgi:hypothetical protein